jgi:hypothetical protein
MGTVISVENLSKAYMLSKISGKQNKVIRL